MLRKNTFRIFQNKEAKKMRKNLFLDTINYKLEKYLQTN